MEFVKDIAAIVGCIMTCISFLTFLCRPIRKSIIDFVVQKSGKSETQKQLSEVREQLDELRGMMESHLQADEAKCAAARSDREALLCLLRNSLTGIYYAYLPERQIPAHQYKNMILLFDAYKHEGGNTYVETIVEDMRGWHVLAE